MRIIIDAMGGDNAPGEIVKGAVQAQKLYGCDMILVGDETAIRACLTENGVGEGGAFRIVHTDEVITMHDDPTRAVREKRGSSMMRALELLRDGEGDACLSAGSTGALLSGATLLVKRVHGIRRAAMAPVLPNGKKGVVLCDCGANAECTSEYLLQFAFLGKFYAERILGIESPRIGLLNNGTEESKGTGERRETYALLQAAADSGRINFIGNVEGSDVFADKADVIVTDGFAGNILLKSIEGTAKFLMKNIKSSLMSSLRAKLGAVMVRKDLGSVKKLLDSSEIGGTPLLGISAPVIKAHGNSNAHAICSAVRQAIAVAQADIPGEIARHIDEMKIEG